MGESMAKIATKNQTNFWQSRRGNLSMAVLALLAMYIVGSRSINTGSLIEYTLTILLLIFAINRLVHTVRNK